MRAGLTIVDRLLKGDADLQTRHLSSESLAEMYRNPRSDAQQKHRERVKKQRQAQREQLQVARTSNEMYVKLLTMIHPSITVSRYLREKIPEEIQVRKQGHVAQRMTPEEREKRRKSSPEEKLMRKREERRQSTRRKEQRHRFEEMADLQETAALREQNEAIAYALWCFWGASFHHDFDTPHSLIDVVQNTIAVMSNSQMTEGLPLTVQQADPLDGTQGIDMPSAIPDFVTETEV